jgi:hypothetical protein
VVNPGDTGSHRLRLLRREVRFGSLEATAGIEINVSILFGLEVSVEAMFSLFAEVLMKNSFVYLSCVWCGVAFLRAELGHLQSRRGISIAE